MQGQMAAATMFSLTVAPNTAGEEGGTWVSVVTPHTSLHEISELIEALGLVVVSFGIQRDRTVTSSSKKPTAFRARFLVTDADGAEVPADTLVQLVKSIEEYLHVKLNTSGTISNGSGGDAPRSNSMPYEHGSSTTSSMHGSTNSLQQLDAATQPHTDRSVSERNQEAHANGYAPVANGGHTHEILTRADGHAAVTRPQAPASTESLSSHTHYNIIASSSALEPAGNGHHVGGSGGADGEQASAAATAAAATTSAACPAADASGIEAGAEDGAAAAAHLSGHNSDSGSAEGRGDDGNDWWGAVKPTDPVDRVMVSPVRSTHKDTDLAQAKALMGQFHISALLVDTGGSPGFITKRDFLKVSFSKSLKRTRVRDVMTQPVIWVHIGTPLSEVARVIESKGVRRVLVVDASREDPKTPLASYVGIVSDTDIFTALGGPNKQASNSSAEEVPTAPSSSFPAAPSTFATSASNHAARLGVSTMSSVSGVSSAFSIVSVGEQAKALSTEERYRAAAVLWELDFNEIEITRKIGEGSFGEVVLGSFRGTKVAVKRLRGFDSGVDDSNMDVSPTMMPVLANFFEREIEILATIRHPNVVNFIGACHTPPNVCLVTEYCARGSLDHLLHKSGLHLDLVKKVEFAMDIARGMSCLHAQRPAVIHRDLKTANLLVSARFEVKVADFGLSRIKDHAQLINSRAGLEGTVEYCAPEVLRGEPYTEKCDLWSYGVVLWELFTRQRPYADADVPIYLLMMSLGNGSLRLPPLKEEQTPAGLVRIVERCMSPGPAERPSFREILHLLENEYKVVRGKAAAVPRCDSASSVVMGGGTPMRPKHVHTQSVDCATPAPAAPVPVPVPFAGAAGGGQQEPPAAASPPRPLPVHVAHALGGSHHPHHHHPLQRGMQQPGSGSSSSSHLSGSPPSRPRLAPSPFSNDSAAESDDNSSTGHGQAAAAAAPPAASRFSMERERTQQQAAAALYQQQYQGSALAQANNSNGSSDSTRGNGSPTPGLHHPQHPQHQHHQQQHQGHAPGLANTGSGGRSRKHRMGRSHSTPLPAHMWDEALLDDDETSTIGSTDSAATGHSDAMPAPMPHPLAHQAAGDAAAGMMQGLTLGQQAPAAWQQQRPAAAGGSSTGGTRPSPSPFSAFASPFGADSSQQEPFGTGPDTAAGGAGCRDQQQQAALGGWLRGLHSIAEQPEEVHQQPHPYPQQAVLAGAPAGRPSSSSALLQHSGAAGSSRSGASPFAAFTSPFAAEAAQPSSGSDAAAGAPGQGANGAQGSGSEAGSTSTSSSNQQQHHNAPGAATAVAPLTQGHHHHPHHLQQPQQQQQQQQQGQASALPFAADAAASPFAAASGSPFAAAAGTSPLAATSAAAGPSPSPFAAASGSSPFAAASAAAEPSPSPFAAASGSFPFAAAPAAAGPSPSPFAAASGSSPFAAASAAAGPSPSPFAAASGTSPFAAPAPGPSSSPFAAAAANASPFAAAAAAGPSPSPSPFAAVAAQPVAAATAASPFAAAAAAGPPPSPFAAAAAASSSPFAAAAASSSPFAASQAQDAPWSCSNDGDEQQQHAAAGAAGSAAEAAAEPQPEQQQPGSSGDSRQAPPPHITSPFAAYAAGQPPQDYATAAATGGASGSSSGGAGDSGSAAQQQQDNGSFGSVNLVEDASLDHNASSSTDASEGDADGATCHTTTWVKV